MKKVTQEDIAKKLNVTRTTIARALNDNGYVEAGLKDKILRTAKELGYKTNIAAKYLAKKGGGGNIYCFIVSYNDEFSHQIELGLRAIENEFHHYGFSMHIITNHPDYPELQVNQLENVLKNEIVDGLIIAPLYRKEINDVLKHFAGDKIPISSLGLLLENRRNLFHVGSNPVAGGILAADLMSKLISNKGKIAVFNTFNQFESLHLRSHGFINAMKKNKEIEIVQISYLENIEDTYEEAKAVMQKYPDLSGMYTNTEVTYLSRAVKDSDRLDIKLVGNDLNEEIMELINSGNISMALYSRPFLQGYLSGKYMFNYILKGITPKKEKTYVGFDIITRANLDVETTFHILTNS